MPEMQTEEDFREQVGTKFVVKAEGLAPVEIELYEVKGWLTRPEEEQGMERFTLFFRGPADFMLPQNTYALEHERMGELLIFFVPVGQDERGFKYQAVFNFHK